jgi:hypothetical protein
MASIGPVTLQIFLNNPSEGMALVEVSYVISNTLDDMQSGRNYRELVQLVSHAQAVEHLVPGGTMWDSTVSFTEYGSFNREPELRLPISSLEQGIISPSQRDPIVARVTLTPLPAAAVTLDSNAVNINPPQVILLR